ncbi:MAG TPA: enolase C-terminal domain-like protein [Gaiellaceae bacterium]|nr:enolase C-terminal domain-like protein [Gaiellaceae bacterium]
MEVAVHACTIPTDEPESDGTAEWDSTTIVIVEIDGGIGYTYCDSAAAELIRSKLAGLVQEDVRRSWLDMQKAVRNAGRPGIAACAIAAVDQALWDRKARQLGVPLVDLLGAAHDDVPVYGSGGFCSYSNDRLQEQLAGWVEQGIPRVKMKLGRDPGRDPARLDAAREAIGDAAELFVDANGAFTAKKALGWADRYALAWNVSWFEEPVSSGDLAGMRFVRERAPLEVAAGEYAYTPEDVRNIVGCVDVLQLDVTRCLGITGVLAVANAFAVDVSAHCAPAISAHVFCAVGRRRHLEYFHDHTRIESMLFDGLPELAGGALRPDRSRPGNGLELRRDELRRWAA